MCLLANMPSHINNNDNNMGDLKTNRTNLYFEIHNWIQATLCVSALKDRPSEQLPRVIVRWTMNHLPNAF